MNSYSSASAVNNGESLILEIDFSPDQLRALEPQRALGLNSAKNCFKLSPINFNQRVYGKVVLLSALVFLLCSENWLIR